MATKSGSGRVLLDVAALADGSVPRPRAPIVSPDEDLLAYSVDTAGDKVFTLRFRDLRTART